MEQLALFAIPRGYKEDGDADSVGAAPGHGSFSSYDRSLVRPDYEDEDNPRLHVAAFQGLQEEVETFLAKVLGANGFKFLDFMLLGEGSTWGCGMTSSILPKHFFGPQ